MHTGGLPRNTLNTRKERPPAAVLFRVFRVFRGGQAGLSAWRDSMKSYNKSMQPTGASRFAQSQFGARWRLAPAADAGRYTKRHQGTGVE